MSQQPSSLQSFFAEMKRRRVFRVMAVYGAAAFVVLQAADLVFPMLELPRWTTRLVLGLVLLGFPFAVVLAWAFETTPEGMRRTAPARPEEIREIVDEPAHRRWPSGLLALAAMALLFGTGWWMGADRGDRAGSPNLLVSEARAADFETLAALPFRNMNGDEANGLIALGIHEDLLSQLSRIASLRVTSRTSVQEYTETDKRLSEIAKELGVAYLLEGSVQSSGSRIRVNVRLVDGATDQQMWTRQFDEDVTPENLFDIQSEISRTVVDALQAQLTPEESAALDGSAPTANSVAQQWYYRGLAAYAAGLSDIPRARDAFAQAVELDPEYTAAWSQLALVESRRTFIGDADGTAARAAMERTEELAPGSVEAHLARGYYEYYARRNFDAALSAFRAAERLAPSDADAAWAVGLILRRQGEWVESTEMMKKAVQLDPRNPARLQTLSENLEYQGAYDDADVVTERELSIDPADSRARTSKVILTLVRDGDTGRARRLADELRLDPRDAEEAVGLLALASSDRDWDRVRELARGIETNGASFLEAQSAYWNAFALRQLGDPAAGAAIDSAIALVSPATFTPGGAAAYRGVAHAWAGRHDRALPLLREADRWIRTWEDHLNAQNFAGPVIMGYGEIGELDAGFDLLDEVVERPSQGFTTFDLRTSPGFDAYRDDPRFADLVKRREAFEAEGAKMGEAGRPWVP